MDNTKQPLGVVTMVYEDYFFLKRWYDHYKPQVGAENLFVFSHGNDPMHRKIAKGANVINTPRDPRLQKWNRRRWGMMSSFVSGQLEFYNWMILTDVDEIVITDPHVAPDIVTYLRKRFPKIRQAPKNIAPLCFDVVHYPADEILPIDDNSTILSRRRTYRPNTNYSKPCLIRKGAHFWPGGHVNSLGPRHLPDGLYMLHLRFFDRYQMEARAEERRRSIQSTDELNPNYSNLETWYDTLALHTDILENTEFKGEDIDIPEFRTEMQKQVQKAPNRFAWRRVQSPYLYRIPERFAAVF